MNRTHGDTAFSVRYTLTDRQTFTIPLSDRDLTIGSAENADIRIDSNTLSRLHARIAPRDGQVYLTDLNSRNGTFLNGKRLQPNIEQEWLPGDYLRLPDATLELLQQQSAQKVTRNDLKLTATPALVKPGQVVRLTLTASGEGEQQVTLQAQPTAPGLAVDLNWQGGPLLPDAPLEIQARVRTTQMSLWGGIKRVRFAAVSQSNLLSTAEVTVRLRTRLETFLLALFLLMGCGATTVAAAVVVPEIIALISASPIPTTSIPPTAVIAYEPTGTPVPPTATRTVTPTETPTLTPTHTLTPVIPTVCPRGSTLTHIVQPGQTLYSIGLLYNTNVAALALNNNISDPDKINAGQVLLVRCGEYRTFPVTVTTPAPVVTCTGVRATSPLDGLACGMNTFYWDAAPGADRYVVNLYDDKGVQVGSFPTSGNETNLTADLSQQAVGGGFSFAWEVQALQNGQVICMSPRVNIPRTPCPTPIPAKPDLVVSAIGLAGQPSWDSECVNLSVPVSYTVKNVGDRASGTFASNLFYYFDGSSDPVNAQCGFDQESSCPETALTPGQLVTFSDRVDFSFEGVPDSIQAVAYADLEVPGRQCDNANYCRVDERDEHNNASTTLNIPIPDCVRPADLLVEMVSATPTCSGVNQFTVSYEYIVINNGPADATSITVKEDRHLSITPRGQGVIDSSHPLPGAGIEPLAAGDKQTITGELTVSAPTAIEGGPLAFTYKFTLDVSVGSNANLDDFPDNNKGSLTRQTVGDQFLRCGAPEPAPDPEPTAEVTPEPTAEVTAEPTAEVTPDPGGVLS